MKDKQYRFYKAHHSTSMAIMQLVDKIANAVENHETTIGVYLDLFKAFDTIDHNILLEKLEHYGFRGIAHDWFKCYLGKRKQYVFIAVLNLILKISFAEFLKDRY